MTGSSNNCHAVKFLVYCSLYAMSAREFTSFAKLSSGDQDDMWLFLEGLSEIMMVILSTLCFSYFLRVTVVKRLTDVVKELDIIVHTLAQYPDMNSCIKMEVGIEDCLHIEFEYNKSK